MTTDPKPHDAETPGEGKRPSGGERAHGKGNGNGQNGKTAAPPADTHVAEGEIGTSSPEETASPAPAGEGSTPEAPVAPLLPRGNPLRTTRGGVTAGLGSLFAFLLMAHNGRAPAGMALGIVFIAVASWGVLDLLGTFDDEDESAASRTAVSLRELAMPLGRTAVGLALFAGALVGGGYGAGPQWLWGLAVTASFLLLVAGIFDVGQRLGPWAVDEAGLDRPLLRREGFWLLAASAALYFPCMGNYSLWDPWETHYGEVAREILARDDWISLWWAQDGWFWSKPVLNFWIQSVAMSALGTHYEADAMLRGATAFSGHPEWVVRAPNVLLTILAMYVLYKGAAKVFGRRAALLGGIVLATMPDWYFLAHQTMTDMPFVAPMATCMGLLLLGLYSDPDAKVRSYPLTVGRHTFRLSGYHLAFGVILVCAVPQILYLASRNLELLLGAGAKGFRVHWDEFKSGSPGNCGLPGNEACNTQVPASIPKSLPNPVEGLGPSLWRTFGAFEPILQGALWTLLLGTLLYLNWGERRCQRLYYLGAWFFAALATMAKGPAGFGLPVICVFAYLGATRRWRELLRLEILSGFLILFVVAMPWYVAMYVRHGSPFTDRLIFHDMFNRAFAHVHDTNEGDDTSFRFYLWQLGYALFPWTALAPLGLTYWLRRGSRAAGAKGDASILLAMWFLFAFALFSFMGTKFHHYIFPAVPAAAMLIGVVLDDMMGERARWSGLSVRGWATFTAGLGAATGLLVFGVLQFFPGNLWGTVPGRGEPPSFSFTGLVLVALGVALLVTIFRRSPLRPATEPTDAVLDHDSVMIGAAVTGGALVLAFVGRDLVVKPEGADQPGAIRLLHLFTYNYRRPWPETLDYAGILAAFTVVAIGVLLLLVAKRTRPQAVVALAAFALVWAVWGLDVYMVKLAPHWGQHEVAEAYYRERKNPGEILVAYQMNWKGENFYTGNRVPAFVSSGANFTTWLKKKKDEGARVMFFVTEHSRIGGLKAEVGAKSYREVTDRALCNKFILVRAEL